MMEYRRGNYFCHGGDGPAFVCQHLVHIERFAPDASFRDMYTNRCTPAWAAAMTMRAGTITVPPSEGDPEFSFTETWPALRPETVAWLDANVPPGTARTDPRGWAIHPEPEPNAPWRGSRTHYTVYFLRKPDAQRFVEAWSNAQPET